MALFLCMTLTYVYDTLCMTLTYTNCVIIFNEHFKQSGMKIIGKKIILDAEGQNWQSKSGTWPESLSHMACTVGVSRV